MCNFTVYGKIPSVREDFKIKIVDIKSKTIKESSIGQLMKNNKIKTQDIEKLIIMVSYDKFDINQVDLTLRHQFINDVEVVKFHEYMNSKYDYFDGDILIQDNIYTHSLINEIISSKYNYFAIYIKYKDSRKIKIKKINNIIEAI